MQTRNGYIDNLRPGNKVFNLRLDQFERHGGQLADDFAMKMGFDRMAAFGPKPSPKTMAG